MDKSIILHVNYVEQGQTIREMCDSAVRWGYDGIEFRRERAKVEETPEAYLEAIARAVEGSGLKRVLFGGPGPNLMVPDKATREKEVEKCVRFYRRAAELFELSVCNTCAGSLRTTAFPGNEYEKQGSALMTDELLKQAKEGFQILGDLAASLNFKFAFETHMNYLHDLPAPSRKLVDAIARDSVGINLDYGNIIHFPKAPSLKETIDICGDKLYEVHLKNALMLPGGARPTGVACGLADGVINNREFLRLLKAKGFSGAICVEAPRAGDRQWFAKQDLAYIKSLLEDIHGETL